MNATVERSNRDFELRPLSAVMAAEIVGLDLRQPLDDATRAAVYAAFVHYQILAFRDQCLTADEQILFSEQFGSLEKHMASNENSPLKAVHVVSNLGPDGIPIGKVSSTEWHSDKSFRPLPSLATILHAQQLPPAGAQTCFASMYLAYESLSAEERKGLDGLEVVHSWALSRANVGRVITEDEIRDAPDRPQPLVRTNPDSGRKSLFLGSHASHIASMPFEEGRALVVDLERRATSDEFVYVHHWQPGDLLMWDNRCLLHKANADFDARRYARVLHRTCLRGTAPA